MINLKELARILECELIGDGTRIIKRIDEVDQADIEALAFAAKKKVYRKSKNH